MNTNDRFRTILVIVTGLLALSWIIDEPLLWKAALVVGALSVLVPVVARAIEWLWMKLALMLGWTNSKVLLTVVYFVFLMPIALLSRVFTKDPLTIRGRSASSLFVERNHVYRKDDLTNVW